VGTDAGADYSAADLDDGDWEPVELPHRTWDATQDANYVYGWYRYHFTAAEEFHGRDAILKLGTIDDIDATFCNGVAIGSTGSFPPNTSTAYNVDREYVIPSSILHYGQDNVIAAKVLDLIGTGGMVGSPRVGYRVAATDDWLFRAAGHDSEADYSPPDTDDSGWQRVPMPDDTWDARQPQDNVFGWYRLRFNVPAECRGRPLVLDLGLIRDADNTYLNGAWIGVTGSLPPDDYVGSGAPRLYELPPEHIRYGAENTLAVKVFNEQARGGIWGRPALLDPTDAALETQRDTLDYAIRLRRARYYQEAWKALLALWQGADSDDLRADILDELTVVYEATDRDKDALDAFGELMKEHPTRSCSEDAVAAICRVQIRRGALDASAVPLGNDLYTQGRWEGTYGSDGFVLCPSAHTATVVGVPGRVMFDDMTVGATSHTGPPAAPISYERFTFGRTPEFVASWCPQSVTEDLRVLRNPITRTRVWGVWDDRGEAHPFDNHGPDIGIKVRVPAGWWRYSGYFLDRDWCNTWHPRRHGIILLGDDGRVLSVGRTGKHGDGVWVRFAVRGPMTVTWRICKNASACASICGFFMDQWRSPLALAHSGAPNDADAALRGLNARYAKLASATSPTAAQTETARALARELDTRLGQASAPSAGEGWMLWQTAASGSPYSPLASKGLKVWAAATNKAGAEAASERFERVAGMLFGQGEYYFARLVADERDALRLAGGADRIDVEGFTQDVVGWISVNDEYALARFDRFLEVLSRLGDEEAAKLLGRAARCLADQPDESSAQIEGPFPAFRAEFPSAIVAVPTPAARVLAWYLGHDPELARQTAQEFLAPRGRAAVEAARKTYEARKYAQAAKSAERALEIGRLLAGAPDVAEMRKTYVWALRLSHASPEVLVEGLLRTRTPEPPPVQDATLRARLYTQLGLTKDCARELEQVRAQLPELRFGHRVRALRTLASSYLKEGDTEKAEQVMRGLLEIPGDAPANSRPAAALAAYEWLGQFYAVTGRVDDLKTLTSRVAGVVESGSVSMQQAFSRERDALSNMQTAERRN